MKAQCSYCKTEEDWEIAYHEGWVYHNEEDKEYCDECIQKLISAGLYFWRMKP